MEGYRKALKKKSTLWLLAFIVSLAGIGLFFIFGGVLFGLDVESRRSFGGMFGVLFIVSLGYYVSITTMLSNETKLKEQYIRSTDERNLNIEVRSSNVTLNIVMVCLFEVCF